MNKIPILKVWICQESNDMNIFLYFPMGKSYPIMNSQLVYKNTFLIATTHPDLVYGTGNAEHGCGKSPRP